VGGTQAKSLRRLEISNLSPLFLWVAIVFEVRSFSMYLRYLNIVLISFFLFVWNNAMLDFIGLSSLMVSLLF
jgi:hypothetical protein